MPETKRKPGRPKNKALSSQIMTGADAWDATQWIGLLPDPDRVLSKLGYDTETAFQDIQNDDHLTAVMNKRLANIQALEWDIEKGDASARAVREIKAIFNDIDLNQFRKDVFRAIGWGMSPIRANWNTSGRIWYPDKLQQIPARWFGFFGQENELRFISTANILEGEPVKPYRLLLPRHNPDWDNPYGEKLLSKSYWLATFKKNCYVWGNRFLEKFIIPWLTAKVPPQTSDTEKTNILSELLNFLQDAVGVFPDNAELEILEPKGKADSTKLFKDFRYMMDSSMSKLWLGNTLTTEIGENGSRAATETHEHSEDDLRDQDSHLVEEQANVLIKWITHFNFSSSVPPKFILEPPFNVSKDEVEIEKTRHEMGVRYTKEYFEDNHRIESKYFDMSEEKEEEPDNKEKKVDPKKDNEGKDFSFSAENPRFRDQAAIEKAIASMSAEELQKQANGLLKPVIELIEKANDYNEVLDNLTNTWPKMDQKELENMMFAAVAVSETIGHLGANQGL